MRPFEGVLLSAVTLDVNQWVFPLVVYVYESKDIDSWTSFLGHLKEYLANSRELTFMMDRQNGVLNALNLEFYGSHNSYVQSSKSKLLSLLLMYIYYHTLEAFFCTFTTLYDDLIDCGRSDKGVA